VSGQKGVGCSVRDSGTSRYTLTCRVTGETQDVYVCPRHGEAMPLIDDDSVRAEPASGCPCDFAVRK